MCEQYDADSLPAEQYAVFLKVRNGILIRLDPAGWYATDDELIALLLGESQGESASRPGNSHDDYQDGAGQGQD